jgi:hypothetical protein
VSDSQAASSWLIGNFDDDIIRTGEYLVTLGAALSKGRRYCLVNFRGRTCAGH